MDGGKEQARTFKGIIGNIEFLVEDLSLLNSGVMPTGQKCSGVHWAM